MPGRLPKNAATRQRTNKHAEQADLDEESERSAADERVKVPKLPLALFGGDKPHPLVAQWWRSIWRSPMASRWLDSDLQGLYQLAMLKQQFIERPTPQLSGEMRQQEARYGLSPLDRRRLEWNVHGPEKQGKKAAAKREQRDPRDVLRALE